MHLYSGLSTDFIRDSVHNRIAEKVKDAFFRQFRFNRQPSEVNSWRNSLRAVSQVIDDANLHDHGILLEYQLPMTSKRLDCMVAGTDSERSPYFPVFTYSATLSIEAAHEYQNRSFGDPPFST